MKDIRGYEGIYSITEDGRLWAYPRLGSSKNGKWLKPNKHYRGYLNYKLRKNNIEKTIFVHQLVARTYIPNPDNLTEINHKNGVKSDNRVKNLEWSDRKRNLQHAYKLGLLYTPRFEEHPQAKLTKQKVTKIRIFYRDRKYNQYQLADMYGVTQTTIWRIIKELIWKF